MIKKSSIRIIFVHGYGNSPDDFREFMSSKNYKDIEKISLYLDGHKDYDSAFTEVDWDSWTRQIAEAVQEACSRGKIPYLVGYSIGATLSLTYASSDDRVGGVAALSPMLGFSAKNEALISLMSRHFPKYDIRRKHLTKKLHVNDHRSETFDIKAVQKISSIITKIDLSERELPQKVLIIHSTNDEVAEYKKVYEFAHSYVRNFHITQLHNGGHDLIYEMNAEKFMEFLCSYFDIEADSLQDYSLNDDFIGNEYKEVSSEHRLWADILFRVIYTFLIGFGALLYNSLSDVVSVNPRGVYYVLSYSSAVSIYVIISNLYIFYTYRTQHYLAEYFHPFDYHKFKANSYISGRWSNIVTHSTYLAIAALPLFLNMMAFGSLFVLYGSSVVSFTDSYLVKLWLVMNTCLFAFSAIGVFNIIKYDNVVFRRTKKGIQLSRSQYNAEKQFTYAMGS